MKRLSGLFTVCLFVMAFFPGIGGADTVADLCPSVVKIYVTIQTPDYTQPWQSRRVTIGNGSGFIIKGRRILTNAHIVSDAKFIEVQREGNSRRYPAEVVFIGHDCDLAVLTVSDDSFFQNTKPLALGTRLPSLNDDVVVLGYPMGGDRLSVTRGVVSRIDQSLYSHSGIDGHLVMQVDAAINPGNSGGPVIFGNRVVGLAFQGLMESQNIGYAIPLPVLRHFLEDIEDQQYDGYPELGVSYFDTRNPALRQDLKLGKQAGGVVLYYIDPFGSAVGILKERDVLLEIAGYPIADDGTIILEGNAIDFTELLERRQRGDSIAFIVWRQGRRLSLTVPLKNPPDPFVFRNIFDRQPEYLMCQGMIFTPLTRNFLAGLGQELNTPNTHLLLYYLQFAKIDGLYSNVTQFVVLADRLAHPANTYNERFLNRLVTEVNGRHIGSLRDLNEALLHPIKGFHVFHFGGNDDPLILDSTLSPGVDNAIAKKYGLKETHHFNEDSP